MMDKLKPESSKNPRACFVPVVLLVAAVALIASCSSSGTKAVASDQPKDAASPIAVSSAEFTAVLSSSEVVDGSLLQLTLTPKEGTTLRPESLKAVFEGQDYAIFEGENGKWVSLVGVPFNTPPREAFVEIVAHGKAKLDPVKLPLKVIDGNYPIENLKVEGKYVDPPKKTMKRILAEQKEIGALYRIETKKRYWSGAFILPIDSDVTSAYGGKRYYNGQMRNFHAGTDLRARTPVPIVAPEGGKVVLAKDLYFTGQTVILDHGYGLFTIYAHMSKLEVKKGQEVAKGSRLGLSGATGRISGPHLHWGLVLQRNKLNPMDATKALK